VTYDAIFKNLPKQTIAQMAKIRPNGKNSPKWQKFTKSGPPASADRV
jgi:hypothetical protein